jgi:hypothetical protein
MDMIAHAIGQLMGNGYAVDGVILNAADYTSMRLLKTSIGSYIFMGEGGAGPDDETIWEKTPLVWQVPMVVSPSMPQGQFIVTAFAQFTILFSREFQNEDDFIRNFDLPARRVENGPRCARACRGLEGHGASGHDDGGAAREREEVNSPPPLAGTSGPHKLTQDDVCESIVAVFAVKTELVNASGNHLRHHPRRRDCEERVLPRGRLPIR